MILGRNISLIGIMPYDVIIAPMRRETGFQKSSFFHRVQKVLVAHEMDCALAGFTRQKSAAILYVVGPSETGKSQLVNYIYCGISSFLLAFQIWRSMLKCYFVGVAD